MIEERNVPQGSDRTVGEGPFQRLMIKGATMIDGTGGPPEGPVDIIIENNRIIDVVIGGVDESIGDAHIIDAQGMYVLPGFIDTHAHIGGINQGVSADYVYKLWLAHGVTTIREPGSFNGADWTLHEKARSEKNEIAAPRIYAYTYEHNYDTGCSILRPEDAKDFVHWAKEKGFDGFKFINRWNPEAMRIVIEEANKLNLGTMAHLSQTTVARIDAVVAAQMGLGNLEHWYGLPEALFTDQVIQNYPFDYNYANEYNRFSQAGRLWKQAAPPYSDHWYDTIDELIELDFTITPTFAIYEAARDLSRAQTAPYHDDYTLPSLWEYFQPNPKRHGSFFFDWTTQDEIEWKENYRLWMAFINEYKNRGGRITAGSDSGFIYKTYGFDFIRELELLQEAGFHPLEVIRSATMEGAEILAKENNKSVDKGIIEQNMLADLIIVEENPLHNLKTLYGTGALKLNEQTNEIEHVGGVKYTIKDGIIYDAKGLLAEVKQMVQDAKENEK